MSNCLALKLDNIPTSLRAMDQWILWRLERRGDKPSKIPYQSSGARAKADTPSTWNTLEAARSVLERYSGLGFVFADNDPFCGIDLDGCRDPQTGRVAEWAREIILALDTYAEVSPSETGVKLWIVGKSPFERGRKEPVKDVEKVCDKEPAIEVYDRRRYFAVTGWRLQGPHEPQARQAQLDALCTKYFPAKSSASKQATGADYYSETAVVERARKYVAKLPPAISGQGGHNATFHAACVLVLGFCLGDTTRWRSCVSTTSAAAHRGRRRNCCTRSSKPQSKLGSVATCATSL
jgi:primase-polymerase (primpol)-like protein